MRERIVSDGLDFAIRSCGEDDTVEENWAGRYIP